MEHMGAHDSPSKYLQVGLPESNHANGNVTSPRNDSSTSLSSKMKRMLSSPKVTRGKAAPSPNRTFGVTLDFLNDRDKTEVPLIVSRICDYLKMHGLKQEGLFRVNGNMKVVERLKNAFDKCGDADLEETGDVPAAASLLKMFLRELSEPVIPDNMQPVFIQIQDQYCKEKDKAIPLFKELVKRMPSANAHLLKYLCTFMLTISDGSETNKMTPLALAIVFGPNIFRCGEGLEGLKDQAYVNAVLLALLQEHEEIFLIDNAMFKDSKPRSVPEKPVAYYDTKKMKKDGSSQSIPEPPLHLGSNLSSEDRMDKSPRRSNSASSPKRTTSSNRRSPRHDSVRAQRTNSAKKRNQTEPERSRSPSSYTHLSSPLSKQLVNNTISSTVKEHLFGPGMLISSTESIETNDRTHESAGGDDSHELAVYPSVMERVKKFSMDSPTHPNVTPTPNKKPKPSSKNSLKKTRSGPTPIQPSMSNVTDKDLDFIQTSGRQPLQSLTHRRAPSQKRRPPSINRRSAARESTSSDDYRETRRPSVGNTSSTPQQGDTIYSLPNKNQPNKREPMTPSMERLELQQKRDDQITGRNHNTMNERQEQEISPGELKKRISSLKRVISNFENEFMETNGRKPKPSEKAQIQKYIAELGRAKQQHKELVTDYKTNTQHVMDVDQDLGGPQLRDIIDRDGEPTKEQTLNNLLRRLEEKRSSIGRAHEILAMSNEQLKEEKLAVQKALLQYENIHGRPSSKEDKTLMRPIYDRYRKIKRLIAAYKDDGTIEEQDSNIKTIYQSDNNEVSDFGRSRDRANSTTPENVLTDDQTPHQHIMDDSTLPGDTFSVTNRLQYTPEPFSPTPLESLQNFDESVLHNASMSELMEQLKETKSSKKKLGKTLKDFEDEFYLANDRKVQKEDRLPHEAEYREYKLIKAKLRLLEALISKRKTSESL